MLFSASNLAIVALLAPATHAISKGCNADNCYRAMFPSSDPARLTTAESFCATFTASSVTATTGYPARFTSGCGLSPSRYSSACSCGPSLPSQTPKSCTDTDASGIVKNAGFECPTLAPWVGEAPSGSKYAVTEPGENNSLHAFEFDQLSPPPSGTNGAVSQNIQLTSGAKYTLKFGSYINDPNAGFIGVKINQQPIYTVDARDKGGPSVWNDNSVPFTAPAATTNLRFEFITGSGSYTYKIDNVAVVPS